MTAVRATSEEGNLLSLVQSGFVKCSSIEDVLLLAEWLGRGRRMWTEKKPGDSGKRKAEVSSWNVRQLGKETLRRQRCAPHSPTSTPDVNGGGCMLPILLELLSV